MGSWRFANHCQRSFAHQNSTTFGQPQRSDTCRSSVRSGEMSVPVTQTAGSLLTTLDSHKPILQRMLSPKVVALVGATEAPNSVGRTLMENLLSFGENLYPINPKRPTVLGVKAFPKIADVPAAVDLAVIATPAFTVPDLVGECETAA